MDLKLIDFDSLKDRKKVIDLIQQYFERQNFLSLKRISNLLLEKGVIEKDKDIIYMSLLPYVLYKILTQQHIINSKNWKEKKEILLTKIDEFEKNKNIIYEVNHLKDVFAKKDFELYRYIKNILAKGKVKQAAKIYSLGISLKKAVKWTDADVIEVKHYLQHSREHELIKFEESIKEKTKLIEKNKNIVFDSSTLISLGNSCVYGILVKLKKLGFNFYIPEGVKEEVISIGNKIIKFAWNANRIERLVNSGVIVIVDIKDKEKYFELEEDANKLYKTKHGNIEILQKGELEGMVLCEEKKALLAVDEITTRLIIENPKDLRKIIGHRYKTQLFVDEYSLKKYYNKVKNISVIRSVDLVAYAYKKGLFKEYKNQNILKALLYSLKYNGCATTFEEIDYYVMEESK